MTIKYQIPTEAPSISHYKVFYSMQEIHTRHRYKRLVQSEREVKYSVKKHLYSLSSHSICLNNIAIFINRHIFCQNKHKHFCYTHYNGDISISHLSDSLFHRRLGQEKHIKNFMLASDNQKTSSPTQKHTINNIPKSSISICSTYCALHHDTAASTGQIN